MTNELQHTQHYKDWLKEIKERIQRARLKAALAANAELIAFYWGMGKDISEKINRAAWGAKVIDQLATDLKSEFPDMAGLSRPNLYSMKRFYEFYAMDSNQFKIVSQAVRQLEIPNNQPVEIVSQPVTQLDSMNDKTENQFVKNYVGQIPWGHNRVIVSQTKSVAEALFYISKTIENGWSRAILEHQIESSLYNRQGKATTNFEQTLPAISSDLAIQILKDPYNFDFLAMTESYKERELENALIENVSKFLLELGTGFAYVGRQVPMQVSDKEYLIDLLFYHLKLHCYVVIELKATEFIPEFAGKLSFYLSVANDVLRHPTDNPTIGLMICKNKNSIIAEYALKNINQPIGVSEYQLTKLFPEEFRSSLPTIEEIEEWLGK